MRILIQYNFKVMGTCDHWPINPPGLHLEPLDPLNFDFNAYPDPDYHSNADPEPASKNNADPDPQTWLAHNQVSLNKLQLK
jgi:hypothetical protein